MIAALVTTACGTSDRPYPAVADFTDSRPTNGGIELACDEPASRQCTITLSEHDGILNCFHGTQTCGGGAWGACQGERLSQIETPEWYLASSYRMLALGTPEACATNPCDPLCQTFNEIPDEPLSAEESSGPPPFVWDTGVLDDPDVDLSAALAEPCASGSDCQANHRCEGVATGAACEHSKCETGDALVATCDPCVESICESDPTCCQRGWNCAHDVCETGARLSATCDDDNPAGSCVAAVCADDASCCTTSWGSACVSLASSLCGVDCGGGCAPGEVAATDGSSCYFHSTTNRSWTQAQAACRGRGTGWDLVTINSSAENSFVHAMTVSDTWTGYNRLSGSWSWSGGSSSYVNFAPGEPNDGSNVAARLVPGFGTGWYDRGSWNSYDYICEGPPAGGGGGAGAPTWEASCAERVASECDAICSADSPLDESGQCVPWMPGETDPACPDDVDLAVGVPCGAGIVPICNHGGVEAPAGLEVSYYAASSGQFPECSPDASAAKGTCPDTAEPIPPGECIAVQCPTGGSGGLVADDRIVVNPAGTAAECSCLDNWSVYSEDVECEETICAGTSSEATFRPVRMFIVMDRSYSMVCHPPGYPATCFGVGPGCTCTYDRWNGAVAALRDFFQAEESAGIGVAIDFFPLAAGAGAGDGCAGGATSIPSTYVSDAACTATPCANPLVPLGILTGDPSPIDTHEQALLNAISTAPVSPPSFASASTPSLPALQGALDWASSQQAVRPDETFIVVFVTDGEPSACLMPGDSFGNAPNTNAALATLAGKVFSETGVRTYTLGMVGSSVAALDAIAAAGGTDAAFVVDGTNSSEISSNLRDALVEIAGQRIDCSFPFTAPENFNPAAAEVVYTSGADVKEALEHRSTTGDCGEGWYYDDNDDPTEVVLCDDTCARVQADDGAAVRVDIPCSSPLEPTVFNDLIYQAECGDAQQVFWQFLNYQTTIPSDGEVRFRLRSANAEADLDAATWIDLKTATASEPVCAPWSLTPGCPIDLVATLGDAVDDEFIELEITVVPGSDGRSPTVDAWEATYSCPFNE